MNVKLNVLGTAVLFFLGSGFGVAQNTKRDTATKTKDIQEVVVLGYGKRALKPKNVAAATTVTAEKFENRPTTSFLNSLQGETPGVAINSSSGSPGSGKISVIIRGVSSINSGTEPLYVIDGMISNSTQFRNLNDSDIESASVMRDAAATAIYGNRAANGVIVITTKRGRFNTPMKFSYSTITGVNTLPSLGYDISNAREILTIENRYGVGMGAKMTADQINSYDVDTNWKDVFFRTGITQRHDLNMSAGGQNVNLYTSLGYMNSTGIVPTSDFSRYTFRNNVSGRTESKRFTYDIQSALSYSKRHQLDEETNSNISNNSIQNPLLGAPRALPYLRAGQFATGQALLDKIGSDFSNGKGIYVLEDILKGSFPNARTETGILLNGDFAFKLTNNLTVGNKSGIDYKYSETNFARAPWSYLALVVARNSAVKGVEEKPFGGIEDIDKGRELNFNSITRLVYDAEIGDNHSFTVGAYLDYLKAHYNSTSQRRTGLNPLNWVFGAGTGYVAPIYKNNPQGGDPVVFYVPSASAYKVTAGTLAYFLTADYDYAGKYGLQGLVRRDGSYRFADDRKWATFWSVAGRWNIDKEAFMDGSPFDMLKLRASYGTQGNQNIITGGTNPLFAGTNLIREVYASGTGYDNYAGALAFGGLKNPLAQWEEIAQANIGLDFSVNKRLSGTIDVYDKTTNQLYNSINLSAVTGSYSIPGNNGKLQNRGIELSLRYDILNGKDANLSVYGNTSYNKSKILSLLKDDNSGSIRNVVGGLLSEWYMAPYVGVNPANGNLLFLNKDGKAVENIGPNDQVATGKSPYPVWMGGFGLNADYKGFYLTSHFSFQQGAWRYDTLMSWLERPDYIGDNNQLTSQLNAWSPDNKASDVPSLFAFNHSQGRSYSDRYIKDASFLRLKNLAVGYSIPQSFLSGTYVRALKVFVSGENLITWTKWKGYDPEPYNSLSVYPNMRNISLGLNLDF
ncbi:SusC/RagA family TonB-linked outer membrane protein [Chryseobacterium taklimakanense]|uniref:SusC/RagA family TonB-linked outer membrane protein n=1 Tax=Chryseobacterium taklimakanense TaxID=536441 RepID=A0A3G8WSM6_9FLAO|nr:SusC/RagA family TonB-linked outer membrane protein [Chryseobacterium taklimakanense]AZI21174.1 SusC/RagA family TonB-linked outer membrane protein [Chryseobacterium taklimakanense]